MPVFTIDVPEGAAPEAKRQVLAEVTRAMHETYRFPDHRGWLREHPAENIAVDGQVGAEPVRPVCSIEAPEFHDLDAKRKLVEQITAAIASGYAELANTEETLILINEYPLQNVGWRSGLQCDTPEIVAAVDQLNAAGESRAD
ncbi:tautomerase family protein [Glycomyces tenuis]|uniref:tautomerase family protein n=1 Tax=Glycomyces tenuis TaxID=58116 RepID=UPI000429A52F|nr:tautomerase family protein [Glycomyces tenuis]